MRHSLYQNWQHQTQFLSLTEYSKLYAHANFRPLAEVSGRPHTKREKKYLQPYLLSIPFGKISGFALASDWVCWYQFKFFFCMNMLTLDCYIWLKNYYMANELSFERFWRYLPFASKLYQIKWYSCGKLACMSDSIKKPFYY